MRGAVEFYRYSREECRVGKETIKIIRSVHVHSFLSFVFLFIFFIYFFNISRKSIILSHIVLLFRRYAP